jgi:AcrR family transcriptional regulator
LAKTNAAGRAVGRPRLFEDETERRMLVDAAIRVMAEKGYAAMSVSDVLTESGLSTRAFYRHFDSKAALLDALMLREAASVGRALGRAVALAPDPQAAVQAWLDRYLDVFYQPRRAERAALITSEAGRASRLSEAMRQEMRRISCAPLIEALRAGHEAGQLQSPTPEVDAYSIHDLVGACVLSDGKLPDRATVRAHVVRFAWPALGLADSPDRPPRTPG